MELVLLWLAVNALIGYALGKANNQVPASILICILLGPIGWLLCILSKEKLRKCPYCAEHVKPEAVVCRHCGRDLPQIPSITPTVAPMQKTKFSRSDVIILVVVAWVLLGLMLWYAAFKPPTPTPVEVRKAKPVTKGDGQ